MLIVSGTWETGGRRGISAAEFIAILAISAILVAVAFFYGTTLGAPATTITDTTTVTTTPTPPATIAIVGKVSTVKVGTSLQSVNFVSQSSGISYPGQISGGDYSVTLPNQDTYTVKVQWAGAFNVGGGACTAGTIPVYLQFDPNQSLTSNWSC